VTARLAHHEVGHKRGSNQPYDVITERMRCSELVARKRVSRGLATLRDVLEER
jgi:hypothetical protein